MCPGEQSARTELIIFFTSLLQKFTFRPPGDEKLSLQFRMSLTISPVSHWLVLFLEPDCQGAGGDGKQEEWACAPAPHLMAGRLLRSEGTAPNASRTGHRNWTQRKLEPNPSFTISSGTLSKSVTLRVISFSSGKYKVENDPSLQNELL